MTIDYVLIGLQALLLGLHGITDVVYESMDKKRRWIVTSVVFLGFAISCIWLEDYAYTIDMNPWVYPAALILAYLLIFTITAARSMKWASTNPALTLNDE